MSFALAPSHPSSDYALPDPEAPVKRLVKRSRYFFLVMLFVPTAFFAAIALANGAPLSNLMKVLDTVIFGGIFLAMFTTIPGFLIVSSRMNTKLLASWKSHNYEWYRKAFPDKVTPNGDVVCRHCGSSHVHAKNLMNRTFMRSHSCNRCGKTLYYSPEH